MSNPMNSPAFQHTCLVKLAQLIKNFEILSNEIGSNNWNDSLSLRENLRGTQEQIIGTVTLLIRDVLDTLLSRGENLSSIKQIEHKLEQLLVSYNREFMFQEYHSAQKSPSVSRSHHSHSHSHSNEEEEEEVTLSLSPDINSNRNSKSNKGKGRNRTLSISHSVLVNEQELLTLWNHYLNQYKKTQEREKTNIPNMKVHNQSINQEAGRIDVGQWKEETVLFYKDMDTLTREISALLDDLVNVANNRGTPIDFPSPRGLGLSTFSEFRKTRYDMEKMSKKRFFWFCVGFGIGLSLVIILAFIIFSFLLRQTRK